MQVFYAHRDALVARFLAVAIAIVGAACAAPVKASPEAPLPQVPVVKAQQRSVAMETWFTGRVEAVHTVELRPRVSGALDEVLFREGAYVSRGTPLFRIDQRPYTIALRRAQADAAAALAQLARARDEYQRAERLAREDAVATEELERRRAEVAALEAKFDLATAAAQDAALELEFATVYAPVAGRIGRAEVTRGNLVNGSDGDGTRLAVLHSTDPIYVYFELDPATAAAAAGNRAAWTATVTSFDGTTSARGSIDFVDNGVGQQTGTLRVRARVANSTGALLPGAVVKVKFQHGSIAGAIVVPEIAIGTDQGTRFVLVAGADGAVQYRPVAIGARTGDWRVVDDSVRAGERIILPGLPGLRPGMKVAAIEEVRQ